MYTYKSPELQKYVSVVTIKYNMPDTERLNNQFQDQSPAFQELADLANQRALAITNQLKLSSFSVDDGYVIPVQSSLRSDDRIRPSRLSVEDGRVTHGRDYPSMIAMATFVALWPNGNRGDGEAVLYQSDARFRPRYEQRSMPLLQAVLEVNDCGSSSMVDGQYLGSGDIIVTDEDTQIHLRPSTGTIATLEGVEHDDQDALRLSLSGKMSVPRIFGLMRVDSSKVYGLDPQGGDYDVTIEHDDPIKTETIPAVPQYQPSLDGNNILVDRAGSIVSDYARAYQNPRLPLRRVLELLSSPLQWRDQTAEFLSTDARKLAERSGALTLGRSGVELGLLHDQASVALVKERGQQPLTPNIIGAQLVLAAVRSMPGELPYLSNLVTVKELERI
jgi:hypothetical protein